MTHTKTDPSKKYALALEELAFWKEFEKTFPQTNRRAKARLGEAKQLAQERLDHYGRLINTPITKH